MAEDERLIEKSGTAADESGRSRREADAESLNRPTGKTADDTVHGEAAGSDADGIASTFHELDADLDRPAAGAPSEPRRAIVADAERIDSTAVPDTYPLEARTEEAIALTVDFGTETETAYLAWPADNRETGLTRLLDALGVNLWDLYGETVLVERQGVHAVIVTPDETPRGRDHRLGMLAGMSTVIAFIGILALGQIPESVVAPLWGLVTFAVFPYLVYNDAQYVKTHSDWAGVPSFWATLSALPFFNLGIVAIYLWRRSQVHFVDGRRSLLGSIGDKVRSWL